MEYAKFRNADVIALHDAHVVLTTRDHQETLIGWRECPELGQALHLYGSSLHDVLEEIGVKGTSSEVLDTYLHLEDLVVGEGREQPGGEQSAEIADLQARVVGPKRLELQVLFCWPGDKGLVTQRREVSYCGAYTVWWSTAAEGLPDGSPLV